MLTTYVYDPKALSEHYFCSMYGCYIKDLDYKPSQDRRKS